MAKCYNDLRDEVGGLHLSILQDLINGVNPSQSFKNINDKLNELNDSYESKLNQASMINLLNEISGFAKKINPKNNFNPQDFELYPKTEIEVDLPFKKQNEVLSGMMDGLISPDQIQSYKIDSFDFKDTNGLFYIFNKDVDLMNKFLVKLKNDLFDMTLFGKNSSGEDSFNNSNEILNDNIKNWIGKDYDIDKTANDLYKSFQEKDSFAIAMELSDITKFDRDSLYRKFVSYHFDKLINMIDTKILKKTKEGYAPNITSSARKGWTDNEFIDFFDEMGSFSKDVIRSRKVVDRYGNYTGEYIQIDHMFNIMNRLYKGVDRTNINYLQDMIGDILNFKLNPKNATLKTKNIDADTVDGLNNRETDLLLSFYLHFMNDGNKKSFLYKSGIIKEGNDASNIVSFYERSKNTYKDVKSSNSIDYFNLIKSNFEKQTGNAYSQIVPDYENAGFKTENLNTNITNKRRREIGNELTFRANRLFNNENLFNDIIKNKLGFEILSKADTNELFISKNGISMNCQNGDMNFPKQDLTENDVQDYLKLFDLILNSNPSVKCSDYIKYRDQANRNPDFKKGLQYLSPLVSRVLSIVHSVNTNNNLSQSFEDKDNSEYNDIKRALTDYSKWQNVLFGENVKSITMTANDTAVPSYGLLNMIKESFSMISFMNKAISRGTGKFVSPIKGNILLKNKNYQAILEPVTNTFISFKGKTTPVAKASSEEIFFNNFMLQYLYNIGFDNYKVAFQPTTFSDKSKQTANRYDGNKITIGRKSSLASMNTNDIRKATLTQTKDYYNNVISNIKTAYSTVFDKDFKSLNDIEKEIESRGLKENDIYGLANDKGVNLFATMYLEKGKMNSLLKAIESGDFNVEQELDNDLIRSVKLLNDNHINIDFDDVEHIFEKSLDVLKGNVYNGNIQGYKNQWVDQGTNRLIFFKDGKVNPFLERYFYEKNLFSEAFQHMIVGGVFSHPAKGKIANNVDNMAKRYVAMTKRTVGVQATMHPYTLGLYNGVSYYDKIAYVKDPTMNLYNQLGDINHTQEVTDGASFSNYLSTILKNNSLLDQGGQVHHKSLGMMTDPESGCFMLMKHADHTQTNERIRNSKYSKYKLKGIMRQMLDINFGEDIDISKSFLGKDIIRDYKLKIDFINEKGLLQTVTGIDKTGINTYNVSSTISQDGFKKKEVKEVKINSLYDLWNVLGAENSRGKSEHSNDMIYNDSSWYNLAEFVNNVGFYKNKENKQLQDHLQRNGEDYDSFRKRINNLRYEDDHTVEYPLDDRPTADSLYQPLKDKFISQITFTSAQKVGATNINETNVLENENNKLRYFGKYSNLYTGLQLDHEHHVDDSDVTEPTQILSAIFFNGDASQYNVQVSQAIKDYIINNVSDYLKDNKEIANIDVDKVRSIIGNQLITELGKKDISGLAVNFTKSVSEKINDVLRESNRLLKIGDTKGYNNGIRSLRDINTSDIPFSDPGIYNVFVTSINNLFTSLGIRRKLEGSMNVISPQNYFVSVHEKNGRVYLGEEVKDLDSFVEYRPIEKHSVKPFDQIRVRAFGQTEYKTLNLDTYYSYNAFMKDHTEYEIEKIEGGPRRLLPHRVQYDIKNDHMQSTKDYYSNDTSKLMNYPEVISKLIKDGNNSKALELLHEYKYVVNSSYSKYNLNSENINKSIDTTIQEVRSNKSKGFELSKIDKNVLKNIQIESYKSLKEKQETYYSTEDIEKFAQEGNLNDILNDEELSNQIIDKYDSSDYEGFYSLLNSINPDLLKVKITNYKELASEVMMPANLAKNFMIHAGDNINDITPDLLANRILKNLGNKDIVSVPYEQVLVENQGNNIYIVNPEEFNKLDRNNMSALYKYKGFSNDKSILDSHGESIQKVGSLEFYKYKDPNGKSYNIATYDNINDLSYLEDFNDGENRYSANVGINDNQENIIYDYAQKLYNNFELSLNGMMCRIPSQSKQSGMPIKIVGFIKTENNISFVPAENLFLTGGDYDIDKVVQTLLSFSRNGKLYKYSQYFIDRNKDFLLESLSLPLPDGKQRNISQYDPMAQRDKQTYYLSDYEKDLLMRFSQNKENDSEDFTLDDFQRTTLLLNELKNFDKIQSSSNLPELNNLMNDYFINGQDYSKNPKAIENAIVGALYHAYADGRNAVHTYAPMDASTVKDVANELSQKGKIMTNFTPTNIMTDVLMQITNMVGKDGIAIAATGQKALAVIINRYLQMRQGKFDNIKLSSNIGQEIADCIGEKADRIYMINGFDMKDMKSQILDYLNTQFSDEEFDGNKQEFIDKFSNSLFEQGDSSLSVSEILTLATDNAKELVLDKINASINTLGMYVYSIAMGVDLTHFTKFMINPVVDKIIELSKPNLIESDKDQASIDNAIKDVLKGYKDPSKYDSRFGYKYQEAIFNILNDKIDNKFIGKLPFEFNLFEGLIEPGRVVDLELFQTLIQMRKLLLNNNIKIEFANLSGRSQEELDLMEENEINPGILSLTKPFYKWFKDSIELNEFVSKIPKSEKIVNVFNRVKEEAEALKVLGQILGVNQSIKSDSFDFYKYQNVLSNYINKRLSQRPVERFFAHDVLSEKKQALVNMTRERGFNFSKFMLDENYRDKAIKAYSELTQDKELNILEILSSSDHFMEMVKMTANLDNFVYKQSSAKYRTLSKLINESEELGYFGTEGGFKKSVGEEIYKKLSNYIDDLTINEFLDGNEVKIKPVNGDLFLGINGTESFTQLQATQNTKPFDLSTFDGRTRFTSWFENVIINMKQTGNTKDINGHEIPLQAINNNIFLKNTTIDLQTDRTTGQDYYFLKPVLNYDPKMDDKSKMIVNEMVKGMKDLRDVEYGGNKLHDLFFLYDLIVNRNKKSRRSFTHFISNSLDSNPGLLSNKYNDFIIQADKQQNYVLPYKKEDFIQRAIATKAFGDIAKKDSKERKIVEELFGAGAFHSTYYYKFEFDPFEKKMKATYYNNGVETKIHPVNISKNIPLSIPSTNIQIDNSILNDMFKSFNTSGKIKIKC